MCVLLFDVFKHLLLRKTDVLKTCRKLTFLEKKFLKKCTNFEDQKDTRYIRENVYFDIIIFSCLSSTKSCLRFLLNCFVRDIKGFYHSSLGNGVGFRDIVNVSPYSVAKTWNFKKPRHHFVDERALIIATLITFCHWKTLVPFCLRK